MKSARCPSCRGNLDLERTIEESWSQPEARGVWVYRVSCAHCLAIVRVERPEIDGAGRAPRPAAPIDTAGSVVARVLERLRAAEAAAELAAEVARLRASEERRLLRVPEVFAIARAVYVGRIRLVRTLMLVREPKSGFVVIHGDIALSDAGDDPRAAAIRATRPAAQIAIGFSDGVILISGGAEFDVLGTLEASVRLHPGALRIEGLAMSFGGVDEFHAPPDALAPSGESP